jgi:hypothetical protein
VSVLRILVSVALESELMVLLTLCYAFISSADVTFDDDSEPDINDESAVSNIHF